MNKWMYVHLDDQTLMAILELLLQLNFKSQFCASIGNCLQKADLLTDLSFCAGPRNQNILSGSRLGRHFRTHQTKLSIDWHNDKLWSQEMCRNVYCHNDTFWHFYQWFGSLFKLGKGLRRSKKLYVCLTFILLQFWQKKREAKQKCYFMVVLVV